VAPEHILDHLVNTLAIRFDRDHPNQMSPDATASELEANVSELVKMKRTEDCSHLEAEMKSAELAGDTQKIAALVRRFKELTS
jgi:hypothetical protein